MLTDSRTYGQNVSVLRHHFYLDLFFSFCFFFLKWNIPFHYWNKSFHFFFFFFQFDTRFFFLLLCSNLLHTYRFAITCPSITIVCPQILNPRCFSLCLHFRLCSVPAILISLLWTLLRFRLKLVTAFQFCPRNLRWRLIATGSKGSREESYSRASKLFCHLSG